MKTVRLWMFGSICEVESVCVKEENTIDVTLERDALRSMLKAGVIGQEEFVKRMVDSYAIPNPILVTTREVMWRREEEGGVTCG